MWMPESVAGLIRLRVIDERDPALIEVMRWSGRTTELPGGTAATDDGSCYWSWLHCSSPVTTTLCAAPRSVQLLDDVVEPVQIRRDLGVCGQVREDGGICVDVQTASTCIGRPGERDSGGYKVHAAARLGISRTTLYSRIKRHSASSDAWRALASVQTLDSSKTPLRICDSCHTTSGGAYVCRSRVHRRPACPRVPFRYPRSRYRREARGRRSRRRGGHRPCCARGPLRVRSRPVAHDERTQPNVSGRNSARAHSISTRRPKP